LGFGRAVQRLLWAAVASGLADRVEGQDVLIAVDDEPSREAMRLMVASGIVSVRQGRLAWAACWSFCAGGAPDNKKSSGRRCAGRWV
jgi:hypothetical protein